MSTTKITQAEAMALAYYGYPEARMAWEAYRKDPLGCRQSPPTFLLPKDWDFIHLERLWELGLSSGYNHFRNAQGALTNQFELLVNNDRYEIVIAFKGSVELENWISDLTDSGAREFIKIQAKAQAALMALKKHPGFDNYHISTVGHSLGGGMAQTFALKNNLDSHVYNSLPLTQGMINTGYFDCAEKTGNAAYKAALERYYASDHINNDVRTANDIATQSIGYKHIIFGSKANTLLPSNWGQSGYLAPEPTVLPGNTIPCIVQIAFIPTLGIMGMDHTMENLRDASLNLSIHKETGKFVIPEGQRYLDQLPRSARIALSSFDDSPIYKINADPFNDRCEVAIAKWQIVRENGAYQSLNLNKKNQDITLTEHALEGTIRTLEFNGRDVDNALNRGQNFECQIMESDRAGTILAMQSFSIPTKQELFTCIPSYCQEPLKQQQMYLDPNQLFITKNFQGLKKMNPYIATVAQQFNSSNLVEVSKVKIALPLGDPDFRRDSWALNYENGASQSVLYHHGSRCFSIKETDVEANMRILEASLPALIRALDKHSLLELSVKVMRNGVATKPESLIIQRNDPTKRIYRNEMDTNVVGSR